ncbi:helix-turn-helix transcriptional regulator [Clostridium beijerinckii]|uniref:helix-turn-helix transcriptional regulator n=1 Tax=Clostridium beijerinckii TaxID=1520 RepID=UPI00156FE294|nr:helix-turn-helix transcriptional regulator [Clostridium beijerinckii]NRU52466.1 transcriptional regulator with XRE-family HTH domain [Clostridium beijerinckii]NYC69089.1 transcriptional regulator with XRE-family HTH domain [Clostridium beijerinckii]
MIGLEYICKINDKQYNDLAEELGIAKQNINLWIKGRSRNIPKKYLPQLTELFNVPNDYFQKELTELDKLKLQKLKLIDDCNKFGLKLDEL